MQSVPPHTPPPTPTAAAAARQAAVAGGSGGRSYGDLLGRAPGVVGQIAGPQEAQGPPGAAVEVVPVSYRPRLQISSASFTTNQLTLSICSQSIAK